MKEKELTAVEWFAMITEAFGHISKIQLKEALRMEKSQRQEDFINGYKARAELSGLIFDEASELTAKELTKQQDQ
jgi:hypothetical protein